MNKIRKGDQVIVTTGRDKGKRGTVAERVDEQLLLVEGINVVKKHVKPNPMKGVTGPKMRVPIGSSLALSSTAALPSNLTREPSWRRTPLAVRTTTAL